MKTAIIFSLLQGKIFNCPDSTGYPEDYPIVILLGLSALDHLWLSIGYEIRISKNSVRAVRPMDIHGSSQKKKKKHKMFTNSVLKVQPNDIHESSLKKNKK